MPGGAGGLWGAEWLLDCASGGGGGAAAPTAQLHARGGSQLSSASLVPQKSRTWGGKLQNCTLGGDLLPERGVRCAEPPTEL